MLPDSLVDAQQEQSVYQRAQAENRADEQLTVDDAVAAHNLARLYPTLPGGIVAPLALYGNQAGLQLANPIFLEAARLQQEQEANSFWAKMRAPVRWAGAVAEELVMMPDRLIRTGTRATQYGEDPLTAFRRAGSGMASQAVRNLAQGRPSNLGTGLFPNSRDPFQTPEFQQDLQAGYDITQSAARAIQRTGVPAVQRSYEVRDFTTLTSVAGRQVPNPTIGRAIASTFLNPDSRAFGLASGALDVAKYIWLDPINIGAVRYANARLARRTFAAGELVGENGMAVTQLRRWIHSPTADEWLAGRDGQKMTEFLANNTSWTRAKAAMPDLPNSVLDATVVLDQPAQIAEQVRPWLGTTVHKVPTPVTTILGRPTLSRNLAGGINRLGDVVNWNPQTGELGSLLGVIPATKWAAETTWAGRWVGQLHRNYMNVEHIDDAVTEAYRFMVQAKFTRSEMDDYLFRLSNLSDGDYVRVFEVGKQMMNTWGDKLRTLGWPDPAIERVKTMWDESFRARAYFIDNAGNHVYLEGAETVTLLNGKRVAVPQVHQFSEYSQRSVPLPPALVVMRSNSSVRKYMNGLRELETHIPVWRKFAKGPLYDDQGWLSQAGDLYNKRIFKPLVLLRPAWVVRVVGEELLRMTAAGLDTPFNHPFRYLAWTMDPDSIGALAKGRRDIFNRILLETPQGKNSMSRIQARMLSVTGSEPRSVPTQAWDVLSTTTIKSAQQRFAVHEGYAREILQLTNEPIVPRLVTEGIDATIDWMLHTPEGRLLRQDMAAGVRTESRHVHTWQNIDTDPDVVRRYVESVYARLHQKTGGKWVARDPNGQWVDDLGTPVTQLPAGMPEGASFYVTKEGNRQLQEIIATRQFRHPKTGEHLLKIEDNMSMRQYRNYREALVEHFWHSKPGFVKSPIELEQNMFTKRMDDVISDAFRLLGERPTNYLSRSPAFTQLYWDNVGYFALGADRQTRLALLEAARRANVEREFLRSVRKWGRRAGIDEKTLRKANLIDLPRPKLGTRPSTEAAHEIVDAYLLAKRPPPDLPGGPAAISGPPPPLPLAPGGTGGAALAIPPKPNNFVSLNPFEQADVLAGIEELNRLVHMAATGDPTDFAAYLMAHPEIVDRLGDPATMGHILTEMGTDFGGKFLDDIPIRWVRKPAAGTVRGARPRQRWASVEVLPEQVAEQLVDYIEAVITQQGLVPQTIDLIATRRTLEEAATSLRSMVGETAGRAATQADGSYLATRATNKGIEVRYRRPPDELADTRTLTLTVTDKTPPGRSHKGALVIEDQTGQVRGSVWYDAETKEWVAESFADKFMEQFRGATRDQAVGDLHTAKLDKWGQWDVETIETVVPWKYLAGELGWEAGWVQAVRSADNHLAHDIVLRLSEDQLRHGINNRRLKDLIDEFAQEGHTALEELPDLNYAAWNRHHNPSDYWDSPDFGRLRTLVDRVRENRIRAQLGGQGQWDFSGKTRLPEPWRDPRLNPHFAQTAPVKTETLLKYMDPEIATQYRRMGDVSGQIPEFRTKGIADPLVLEYHIQTRELRVVSQEKLVSADRLNAESVPVRVYVRQNPFDELDYTVKVNTKAAKDAQVRCAAGEHPCARNFPGGNDDNFSPAHLLSDQSIIKDDYIPPPKVYVTQQEYSSSNVGEFTAKIEGEVGAERFMPITLDELPDEVYHVTAFTREIADDGTIRAAMGGGMDGDPGAVAEIPSTLAARSKKMRVSLTDNPEIAVQLAKDFRNMARWSNSPEALAFEQAADGLLVGRAADNLPTLYHGGQLPEGPLAYGGKGGIRNLFGNGLYATSSDTVATGYAGKKGTVSSLKWLDDTPPVVIDLETPAGPLIADAITNWTDQLKSLDWADWVKEEVVDLVRKVQAGEITGAEAIQDAKYIAIADTDTGSFSAAEEILDMLNEHLQAAGIDALRYQGGVRVARPGDELHEAIVFLDPSKVAAADTARSAEAIQQQMQPFLDMIADQVMGEFQYEHATRFIKEHLNPEKLSRVGASPTDIFAEYFAARSSFEEIANPILFGDIEHFRNWNPENIGIIAIPKENLNTGAAMWRFDKYVPSGSEQSFGNSLSEISFNGDINIAGGRTIVVPYDHADTVDMYVSAFTRPDGTLSPNALAEVVDQGWLGLTDESGIVGTNLVTDSDHGSTIARQLDDAYLNSDYREAQRILEELREEAAQLHLRNPTWTDPDDMYDPVQDIMDMIPLDESISAMFHQINLDPIWVRLDPSDAPARELLENYLDSYGWVRAPGPEGSDIFVNPRYLEDAPLADLSLVPEHAVLLSGEDAQDFIQNNVEMRFNKREADDIAAGGPPTPPPPAAGAAGRYFDELPEGEINNMQMIDELAKNSAMRGVKNLLYDISNTHGWAAGTRLVFPFGEAWQEIITRWAKLIQENPRIVRRVQQAYHGGYGSGFIYDNEYGDPTFAYPGNKLLGSGLMAAGRALKAIGADSNLQQGLEGTGSMLKEGNLRLTGSVKGLNLIGEVIPGMGPTIQAPVAMFAPDSPLGDTIKNFVFPFGWPDINTPGGLFIDSVLPAWARKIGIGLTGLKPTSPQHGIFTSTVNDLYTLKLFRGEGDPGDPVDQERLKHEAQSQARTIWILSSILQSTLPTGPLREYRVKVNAPPIEQTEVDHAVDLGANFVTLRALANENSRYMQAYSGDRLQATKAFIDMFGVDPLFDRAQTFTVRPMSVQEEGRNWFLENGDIFGINAFPTTAYYAYPDMPDGEYLQEAYERQKNDRDRPPKSTDQYMRDIAQVLGQRAYEELRRKGDQAIIAGESTSTAVEDWLRAWRQVLKTEFYGYGLSNFGAPEGATDVDRLHEFRRWHTEPRLAETEAGQGVIEFMALWDKAEAQGLAAGLTVDGWYKSNAAAANREWLREHGERLTVQYPDFYHVWIGAFRPMLMTAQDEANLPPGPAYPLSLTPPRTDGSNG